MNVMTHQSVAVIMTAQTPRLASTVLVILDTGSCPTKGLVMTLMSAVKHHQCVARFVKIQWAPTSVSVHQATSVNLTGKPAGKIVTSHPTLSLATAII